MQMELLTIKEIAEQLKVQPTTVLRWCREGKMPAVKIGKSYRMEQSALAHWFEWQREEQEMS